jgi:hypothetical protein
MRTLIAASAFVSLFAIGAVVSACGSSSSQPTAPTATATVAGGTCPPPGYPNPPPGCIPYGQPTGQPTAYTPPPGPATAPPPPGPGTAPPPAPTTTATGMSTAGTIACTDDGPVCGTAHCNKAIGKCATPCGSTQFDCVSGNYCTVMPLVGPICQPVPNVGQVLP